MTPLVIDAENSVSRATKWSIVIVVLVVLVALGTYYGLHRSSKSGANPQAGPALQPTPAGSTPTTQEKPATTTVAATAATAVATTETSGSDWIWITFDRGNEWAVICQDLYKSGKAPVYTKAALLAVGPGMPDHKNPSLILVGGFVKVPRQFTVGKRTYTADLERAKTRSLARAEKRIHDAADHALQSGNQKRHATSGLTSTLNATSNSAPQHAQTTKTTTANAHADAPSKNIQTIGTIGANAPPTGKEARKKEDQ